jgi:general secretion pathway protein C
LTKPDPSPPLPETDDEAPAPPGRRAARRPVRDSFTQELNQGIRKLDGRRYEIKRGTLELALGNLASLARSVRVRPEVRDGKAFGFRLFAIRADVPFAKLGLRNDDVLVSINGLDLATPERALDAYGKLKESPRLGLGLLREGHETTQEYTIR